MAEVLMTPERWKHTEAYVQELFAVETANQRRIMPEAAALGLRPIEVGAGAGRFLQLLLRMLGGRLAIEVGTLAGYSASWLAKGLATDLAEHGITGAMRGVLYSIEFEPKHAQIASENLRREGLADAVKIRVGKGSEELPKLLAELGPGAADLILFDADRSEYTGMLPTAHALLRVGGMLVIDNALAAGKYTADPVAPGEEPDPLDLVNRAIAKDARFMSTLVPVGNGLLLCLRL